MNLIDVVDKIYEQFNDAKKHKSSKITAKLSLIIEVCDGLLIEDNISSDNYLYLHEKLKSLYKQASKIFQGDLDDKELNIVLKAIGSSRIYFWLSYIEKLPHNETEKLVEAFKNSHQNFLRYLAPFGFPLNENGSIPISLLSTMELIAGNRNSYLFDPSLKSIKRFCVADISDLHTLITIKTTG